MTNKQIKAALQLNDTKFTVAGRTSTQIDENDKEKIIQVPVQFKTHAWIYKSGRPSHAVGEDFLLATSSGITKFGSAKMITFTYLPFGKKVTETIRYEDITIIKSGFAPIEQ